MDKENDKGGSNNNDPYELFLLAIKSPSTKKMYQYALDKYRQFCHVEEYSDLLKGDDKEIEDRFQQFILQLNGDDHSNSMRNICYSAVRLFYVINRRNLNYAWLARFKKHSDQFVEDRPYSKDDIEKMIEATDSDDDRTKAIILIFATSGIRLGALATMQIKHARYLESEKLFALSVYPGSREQYLSFITPQASRYLLRYLKKRYGLIERAKPDQPLIGNVHYPEFPANEDSLGKSIRDIAIKAGLRPAHDDQQNRKPIMRVHGFRKFFATTLAGIDTLQREKRERLLGHITGLDKFYVKLDVPDLLPEYSKAVNLLTFNAPSLAPAV